MNMGGSETKPVAVPMAELVPVPRSYENFEGTKQKCGRLSSLPTDEDVNAFEDAIRHGKAKEVEEMVSGCPLLLEALNLAGENPFHVAIKAGQFDCLKVLTRAGDGRSPLYLQMILNQQDQDGNTALDLWYSLFADRLTPQTQIPRPGEQITGDVDPDTSNLPIMRASQRARQRHMDSLSLPVHSNSRREREEKEISKVSALVTVGTFVAAATFACLFSLNTIFPDNNDDMKMMAFSELPPDVFIFLVFNSAAFIGSMLLILTNTFSLVAKWSPFYKVVPMVVMAAMFTSYALLLKNVLPKHLCFAFASHTCSISSFSMVWIYNFGLLSFILAMWFIGFKICSAFFNPPT